MELIHHYQPDTDFFIFHYKTLWYLDFYSGVHLTILNTTEVNAITHIIGKITEEDLMNISISLYLVVTGILTTLLLNIKKV